MLVYLGAVTACGGSGPTTPSPRPQGPVLIEQHGPVQIGVISSSPAFGSTLTGCGNRIAGCAGRVRMRVQLRAQEAGPVLFVTAFLHATNQRACLIGRTPGFTLAAGEVRTLDVVYDETDDCLVPLALSTMAIVVEGPTQISSRRAWSMSMQFEP
jgi:hypothetical protein